MSSTVPPGSPPERSPIKVNRLPQGPRRPPASLPSSLPPLPPAPSISPPRPGSQSPTSGSSSSSPSSPISSSPPMVPYPRSAQHSNSLPSSITMMASSPPRPSGFPLPPPSPAPDFPPPPPPSFPPPPVVAGRTLPRPSEASSHSRSSSISSIHSRKFKPDEKSIAGSHYAGTRIAQRSTSDDPAPSTTSRSGLALKHRAESLPDPGASHPRQAPFLPQHHRTPTYADILDIYDQYLPEDNVKASDKESGQGTHANNENGSTGADRGDESSLSSSSRQEDGEEEDDVLSEEGFPIPRRGRAHTAPTVLRPVSSGARTRLSQTLSEDEEEGDEEREEEGGEGEESSQKRAVSGSIRSGGGTESVTTSPVPFHKPRTIRSSSSSSAPFSSSLPLSSPPPPPPPPPSHPPPPPPSHAPPAHPVRNSSFPMAGASSGAKKVGGAPRVKVKTAGLSLSPSTSSPTTASSSPSTSTTSSTSSLHSTTSPSASPARGPAITMPGQPSAADIEEDGVQRSKRRQLLRDLVQTEKTFVRSLRRLAEVFVYSLRKNALPSRTRRRSLASPVFARFNVGSGKQGYTQDQVDVIFGNIEGILNCHKRVQRRMETTLADMGPETPLSPIIFSLIPALKLLTAYARGLPAALNALETLARSNTPFRNMLDMCEREEDERILEYLDLPIKRLPKYRAFVEGLIENALDKEYTDRADCILLGRDFRGEALLAQFAIEEAENQAHIVEIQRSIFGLPHPLADPSRRFLKIGTMYEAGEPRLCVLFDDLFLWGKPGPPPADAWVYGGKVPLKGLGYSILADSGSRANSFRLASGKMSLVLSADSDMERRQWVADIGAAVTSCAWT
ncbi:hypothetical protein BJ684DRAFT_16265 [Piptocephalis cylindrospora]|uniref:DH domain-containing protein n=1 Tax=Piptocephalis cylindrospora TaxID=1907219 RepID=A0A4P9Y325_9FUNG|nr:hypothetical protein BJ684DRAFT_16265 [Piptocephalis cylindrospora]|eukprot:RKP13326.1 hypothetical protein BJ684DRAFT_16265 [Piptocephalis cylindrospora]